MQKWEYKTVRVDGEMMTDDQLNSLGRDGWELVYCETHQEQSLGRHHRAIFKRLLND